jgi:hypothetical protein
VILDSGNESIEKENQQFVSRMANENPDVLIHYLPFNIQKNIIKNVLSLAKLPENWNVMFLPSYSDYGAMMNKIYVFAIIGGFNVIHRRDSDTILQQPDIMPILNEMRIFTDESYKNVAISGSGYVGEWNLDIRNFAENNTDAFSDFLSSLSIPDSAHEEYMKKTIDGSKDVYSGEDDVVSFNETATPEAGNFAMRYIQELLPCLPARLTLGTDYFPFKVSAIFGYAMVFHQRRVQHLYHVSRREQEYYKNYLTAIYKLCDHSPVYWHLIKALKVEADNGATFEKISAAASDFLSEPETIGMEYRKNGKEVFLNKIVGKYFPEYYGWIQSNKHELDLECNYDYQQHARLIRNWPTIIESAKKLSERGNILQGV